MRCTTLIPVAASLLALAAPASAVSDFRLPDGSAQQLQPERQGPVAPDVPESRRPAPTPAPTARAPAPSPSPTAATPRVVVPDVSGPAPRSAPSRTVREPAASASPTAVAPLPPTADAPAAESPTTSESLGFGRPTVAASPPSTATGTATQERSSYWPWVLAALAALGLLGGAGFAWRRWRQVAGPVAVTEVERPRLTPAPPPAPQGAPVAPVEPLQVTLEPLRLSLTLMNATLAYRLEVANRGLAPILGLGIGADMIAAHASMSREEQLSGPGSGAPTVQRIERLEPGESRIVEGEFRLPFPQIVPIRQGNAALLLPLARFRLEADGAKPVVRTFVVGQPGNGSALQPFRLDQGPRIYPKLAQHAFA